MRTPSGHVTMTWAGAAGPRKVLGSMDHDRATRTYIGY